MGTENRITEAKLYLKLVVNSFLLNINFGKTKKKTEVKSSDASGSVFFWFFLFFIGPMTMF